MSMRASVSISPAPDGDQASAFSISESPVRAVGRSEGVLDSTSTFLETSVSPPDADVFTATVHTWYSSSVSSFELREASWVDHEDEPPITHLFGDSNAPRFYLTEVCRVVELGASGALELSDAKHSCYYPFGRFHSYSSQRPQRISIRLRLATDPYVLLQEATRGTSIFAGETLYERNVRGGTSASFGLLAMLVFGILLAHVVVELADRRARLHGARSSVSWHHAAVRRPTASAHASNRPGRKSM